LTDECACRHWCGNVVLSDSPFHFKREGLTGKQDTLALVIKKDFAVQIFRGS